MRVETSRAQSDTSETLLSDRELKEIPRDTVKASDQVWNNQDALASQKLLPVTDGKTEDVPLEPDEGVVDSPWSFVVAVASFFAQAFLGGYAYTGGIFYTVFTHEFPDAGTIAISWLCSLPLTLWFVGSPIGSILTNRFGCRACSIIGGGMATLGLSLCYFATEFYMVFICYGLIAGLGMGIQYVGFVTSVSRYFKKYRTIVIILTTIGPTFGMTVYSILVPYLMRVLHWRSSLLILGGLSSHVCACACVLFPLRCSSKTKQFLSIELFKKKKFIIFCFQCIATNLGNAMLLLHLPSLILTFGLNAQVASLSLTVFAACNSAAKVIYSVLGHICNIEVTTIYTFSLVVVGVSTIMIPLMRHMEWVLICVACNGFTFSVMGGHCLEVIYELAGPENFSDGVGATQIAKAIGTIMSGPIAGSLYKQSGHFSLTFPVSGVITLVGTLILAPVIFHKCRKQQKERKSSNNVEIIVKS